MHRFVLICLFFSIVFGSLSVVAQVSVVEKSNIVEQYKGKPYYIHFVKKTETLYSISKAYNVSVDEIKSVNPLLTDDNLKEDVTLKIPKKDEKAVVVKEVKPIPPDVSLVKTIDPQKQDSKNDCITHKVKRKETLYSIAKQYNITQEEIVASNAGLGELKAGIELCIPQKPKKTTPVVVESKPNNTKGTPPSEPSAKNHLYHKKHTVIEDETIYSISKDYNLAQDELIELNPELKDGLKTGQQIWVPSTEASSIEPRKKETIKDKPVSSGNCDEISAKDVIYNVALLMPLALESADTTVFSESRNNSISAEGYKSYEFFQFYCGAMLALDQLETKGVKLKLHVYDAEDEKDVSKIKKVLQKPEMAKMDLIIGPFYVNSFELAAKFALQHQIPIVNPLSRRDKIIEGNPFVFKVQPSTTAVSQKLVSLLNEKEYADAKTIIVVKYDKKENVEFVGDFIAKLQENEQLNPKVKVVEYATEKYAGVVKHIDPEKKNLIFFLSSNKNSIPTFISQLDNKAKDNTIVLFGMPNIEKQQINIESLENLSYHSINASFVDYGKPKTINFIKEFRKQYKAEPLIEKYAFLGFDMIQFFGQLLYKYGNDFPKCIKPSDGADGIQYHFDFYQKTETNGYLNSDVRVIYLNEYEWKSRQ